MSTPATIILKHADHRLRVTLDVHYDGYPAHTGAVIARTLLMRRGTSDAIDDIVRSPLLNARVTDSIRSDSQYLYTVTFGDGPAAGSTGYTNTHTVSIGYAKRAHGPNLRESSVQEMGLDEFIGLVNDHIDSVNRETARFDEERIRNSGPRTVPSPTLPRVSREEDPGIGEPGLEEVAFGWEHLARVAGDLERLLRMTRDGERRALLDHRVNGLFGESVTEDGLEDLEMRGDAQARAIRAEMAEQARDTEPDAGPRG